MRNARFNHVMVGELTVNFLEKPQAMVAKAAFVNTEDGHTYGSTTCRQWSATVQALLLQLRTAMEQDLAAIHFVDGPVTGSSATMTAAPSVKGIGEAFGGGVDAPPA